jgi:hypothetical protein
MELEKDPAKMTAKELRAAVQAEADARTTPQLYFITAKAYHASARSLMNNPIPRLGHADAPIRALIHHAVELYLKAFLLHSGMTPAELRNGLGHNYEQLVDEALNRGLVLGPAEANTLKALKELGAFSQARYPVVGSSRVIGLEVLNVLCNALLRLVGLQVLGALPPARADLIDPI